MSTHIGTDRCSRCGGGSNACPVCNPIPESTQTMKIALSILLGVNACIGLLIFVMHHQI